MYGLKEKKERSLGVRLHIKGERCDSPKCAMVRKPYPAGAHGQTRSRKGFSEFGLQLKEKQKFKLSYGLDERGLRRVFAAASNSRGSSAMKLLELLERRLNSVVFQFGFAPSINSARQLIAHGHITVNGKVTRSPSFEVNVGDVVGIKPGSESKEKIVSRREALKKKEIPPWLELDKDKLQGKVVSLPQDTKTPFEINLLVEALSK